MTKGFTLIELLIALTISTLILGSLFQIFYVTLSSRTKIVDEVESLAQARVVLERIVREVRTSRGIDPSSTKMQLILNFNPDTVSYDFKNSMVRRRINSYSGHLTTKGAVQSLRFDYPSFQTVEIRLLGRNNTVLTSRALVRDL